MTFKLDPEAVRQIRVLLETRAPTIIEMAQEIGADPATFFEGEDWSGLDLRPCNLFGVSFRNSTLDGVIVYKDQAKMIKATKPKSMAGMVVHSRKKNRKRIFLAHANEDKSQVRQLYNELKLHGFHPWLDTEDLIPGQKWREEIQRAIESATVYLACFSKKSLSKGSFFQSKFHYALSTYADRPPGSIYLIPVRLDDCEVPDIYDPALKLNLRDFFWVDLFEDGAFEKLVDAIKLILKPSVNRFQNGAPSPSRPSYTAFPIEEIEGIGPVYGKKLSAIGITNTKKLLDRCASAKGRREVARGTGLDDGQLLKWANLADLMRISGIGKQFSELLEAAGVDTVKELRNRRADNLSAKMKEINVEKKLTRSPPSEKQVASWVDQAKRLRPLDEKSDKSQL